MSRARRESTGLTSGRQAWALMVALGGAVASVARGGLSARRVHLETGDAAPDFELSASDGETYRLSRVHGTAPVVVAWFPKAFTPGCTAECRSIGLTRAALAEYDAVVFAACCDSVAATRAFAEATGIGVPILADHDRHVAAAYGVLGRLGVPDRWTFYIGVDGRILHVDRAVHAADHGAAIRSTLDRLQVTRRP